MVMMARQLVWDPPRPNVLRRKPYENAGYASEVAHLTGVGDYASDAWRLFCRVSFYAGHGVTVADEWRFVQPTDPQLRRYIAHRRHEEQRRTAIMLEEELLAFRLMGIRLAGDVLSTPKVVVGSGDNALHVPRRIVRRAIETSIVIGNATASMAVPALAS